MAEPPTQADSGREARVGRDREAGAGTPRWVKVSGLIALAAVVLFVVVMLVGGGEHGPGRHTPGGGPDSLATHTGPPSGFEHDDQQP